MINTENEALKLNFTKYSGLPLKSLIFLVSTNAPIDEKRRRVVWLELYHRYFKQGRTFNLYAILRKDHVAFGNTIGWELEREEVEIPTEHAEDFIKNLLSFIGYIDKKVLESGNLRFEWQLHELAGIKSMIERVRDAKIKDMNTRQKVNLFIDKMNAARKETLLLIEAAKAEEELSKMKGQQAAETQIVAQGKTELMKQELRHLNIPMSKVTKAQWTKMIEEFDIYYPEDQKKIIRFGIKKYAHDLLKVRPWDALLENMDLKDPNIDMYEVLNKCLRHSPKRNIIDRFESAEMLLDFLESWYRTATNSDSKTFENLRLELLDALCHHWGDQDVQIAIKSHVDSVNQHSQIKLLEESYWLVEKYSNGPLSRMLLDTHVIQKPTGDYYYERVIRLKYDADGTLVQLNPVMANVEVSAYTFYNSIYKQLGRLAQNNEPYYESGEFQIDKGVPDFYHDKIRDFFKLVLTLEFDKDVYAAVTKTGPSSEGFNSSYFSSESSDLEWMLRYKFLKRALSTEELKWLYIDKEGYAFFKVISKVSRHSGAFHNQPEYLAYYLKEALQLFNFSKDEHLKHFFQLDFSVRDIYQYKYIKPEIVDDIVKKLKEESPHELSLVCEFFDGIEEEYTFFEVKPEYADLTPMEKLLLFHEGIEIGQVKTEVGFRERMGRDEVSFTTEQARNKFVFEYYKNFYSKKE